MHSTGLPYSGVIPGTMLNPGNAMPVLGFNFSKVQQIKTRFLDTLQNQFRIFSLKSIDLKRFVRKLENTTYFTVTVP